MTHAYPNPGFRPEDISFDDRYNSIKLKPKYDKDAGPAAKRLRSASFFSKGPKLYETVLPLLGGIENICDPSEENLKEFKKKLDTLLETIPDEPEIGEPRPALTNSILDQIRYRKEDNRKEQKRAASHQQSNEGNAQEQASAATSHQPPRRRHTRQRRTPYGWRAQADRPFVSRWDLPT